MHCYFNNGRSVRLVDESYVTADGEVLFTETPSEEQLKEAFPGYDTETAEDIKDQIARLEFEITPRRLREFALGLEKDEWLKRQNDAIEALRNKFKK